MKLPNESRLNEHLVGVSIDEHHNHNYKTKNILMDFDQVDSISRTVT